MENKPKNNNKQWYKILWIGLIILVVLDIVFTNKEKSVHSSTSSNTNNIQAEKISESDIPGVYNNFKMNYQFRIYQQGRLEFYTETSMTPHNGTWALSGNQVKIRIPDWISEELSLTVKKDGFYNDNKLIWIKNHR